MPTWPKLFQKLRSSRAIELAAEYPGHVAAEWIGHSTAVADKHYWRVTKTDFEKAQQKAQQQAMQGTGTEQNTTEQKREKPDDYKNHRVPLVLSMLPVGPEPTTY